MNTISPRAEQNELGTTISEIAGALRHLDPGPLAELRRMEPDRAEALAPYFWRLASRHGLRPHDRWALIVKMMAILTDKATRGTRPTAPHPTRLAARTTDGAASAMRCATARRSSLARR
jgi:CRISPR system Cascade subunit CasB